MKATTEEIVQSFTRDGFGFLLIGMRKPKTQPIRGPWRTQWSEASGGRERSGEPQKCNMSNSERVIT